MMRAIAWGAAIALLAVAVVTGLVYGGVIAVPEEQAPQEVLVIATGPDEDGAEVAAFAFVVSRPSNEATVLDTLRAATIAGTSAGNPRDAYPYVGASGVAAAMASQTGGSALPWIVVPQDVWGEVVTAAGGITLKVDKPMSSYTDGALAVLEPGNNKLDGDAVAAAAAGLDDLDEPDRKAAAKQLTAGISAAFAADKRLLAGYVAQGRATTSLTGDELADLPKP